MFRCKYALDGLHECASDCIGSENVINVREWAENELPYPTHDDVPLTEDQRNRAIDLLLSLDNVEDEPTRVGMLTDSSIELLQHGLVLVNHVLRERHNFQTAYEDDHQYGRDTFDSLHKVRSLYNDLEKLKGKESI